MSMPSSLQSAYGFLNSHQQHVAAQASLTHLVSNRQALEGWLIRSTYSSVRVILYDVR